MKIPKQLTIAGILLIIFAFTPFCSAICITYDSKIDFLADTGATSATKALPNKGEFHLDEITIEGVKVAWSSSTNAGAKYLVDWSSHISGNELAMGWEDFTYEFLNGPVSSFGFEIVELEFGDHAGPVAVPITDSTFGVTLFNSGAKVGYYEFNPPNDTAAFFGVSCDYAFDSAWIHDLSGSDDNDLFGQVYTATQTVPSTASTLGLLATSITALFLFGMPMLRRKR